MDRSRYRKANEPVVRDSRTQDPPDRNFVARSTRSEVHHSGQCGHETHEVLVVVVGNARHCRAPVRVRTYVSGICRAPVFSSRELKLAAGLKVYHEHGHTHCN